MATWEDSGEVEVFQGCRKTPSYSTPPPDKKYVRFDNSNMRLIDFRRFYEWMRCLIRSSTQLAGFVLGAKVQLNRKIPLLQSSTEFFGRSSTDIQRPRFSRNNDSSWLDANKKKSRSTKKERKGANLRKIWKKRNSEPERSIERKCGD